MTDERKKLKDFLEENIPFGPLKKAGFFSKEIKKTDYEKIAARICWYFGYENIYQYRPMELILGNPPTTMSAKAPDSINQNGELVTGACAHIDIIETEFTCPICTCPQDASESKAFNNAKYPVVTIKCKGCKRKLIAHNDISGNLTITEK